MKLKQGLLYSILDNHDVNNKYSKAFNNLKNVIELETKETSNFDENIINKYKDIQKKYLNFFNKIPLNVIETYFFRYSKDLNDFVYIEYQGKEVNDTKVIDLYILLENFYQEVFTLACEIANFYNIEIKLNQGSNKSSIESV